MSEIEEVKARLDIADVVGQHVQLHKAGRTLKGLCPFHPEKTPSFIVSPDRQTWHCFGACGTGGDVISFVMKHDGLDFGDALRLLAERTGVKLKERHISEEQDRARKRLHDANEAAAEYFTRQLATDAGISAQAYVERRGIDEATSKSFRLGYSLAGWSDAIDHLRGRGFTDREIVGAGIAIQGENGLHDRFRSRLMFPVWDAKGRIIGFGARALEADAVPKYLNTAQTPLFDKGGTLYALNKAGTAIKEAGRAVIVEGYMDVIAAHQFGFENVVAQMGTALTERQVRLLNRLAPEIILALDADAAGENATVRGHQVRLEAPSQQTAPSEFDWRGVISFEQLGDLRIAVVPEGKDPDDLIRVNPDAWRALIEEARPVLEFRLEVAAASHDLTDPRGRSQLVQEYLPLLSAVGDPVIRAHYLQRLSRIAQVSEEELTSMVTRSRGRPEAQLRRPVQSASSGASGIDQREAFLVALLLRYPGLRELGASVSMDLLWGTEARHVLRLWQESESLEVLKTNLPTELMDYLDRLILWKIPPFTEADAAKALLDCLTLLKKRVLAADSHATAAQIAGLQEELGGNVITTAFAEGSIAEVSPELQETLHHGEEIGNELHKRERKDGREAVQSGIDG